MANNYILKHDAVSVLRTFSERELKKFGNFLDSPYFSMRPALKTLFDELMTFHPLYTHVDLTKEYLYRKVYPGNKFNDDSMRDLLSSLHEASLRFLAYENLSKDINSNFNLFKELKDRNLIRQLSSQLYKMGKNIGALEGVDTNYFLLKFRFAAELNFYDLRTNKYNTQSHAEKLADQTRLASIYIIIYFISEISTNYTNLIINADRFSSASLDKHIYETIKGFSPEKLFAGFRGLSEYDFVIDVYKALMNAFIKRGSWNAFSSYKRIVMVNYNKFSHAEKAFHTSHLISSSILGTKYSRHRGKFDTELLHLYGRFLDNNLFVDEKVKYVPAGLFRSIVFHGVKMNALSWLYKVISGADGKLNPDERENLKNYAWAQYYFASGNFDESLKYINMLSPDNFIFKFDVYELKLRIFYDRMQYEGAIELIHTYRQFIRKDPMITPARKNIHRNFAYYLEKLIKASYISSRIDAEYMVMKLQKSGYVYHKEWLLERFQNLAKPAAYRKII